MAIPGLPPPPGTPPPHPMATQQKVKKQPVSNEMFEKMAKDVNTVAANLRILEERYSLMRNKSQVTEGSMIELERGLSKDLKMLNDEIVDLKHEIREIMDKLRLIDAEIRSLTKKEEFKVIERYLDMWQPMEFVTRNELGRMIDEKMASPKIARPVRPAEPDALKEPGEPEKVEDLKKSREPKESKEPKGAKGSRLVKTSRK